MAFVDWGTCVQQEAATISCIEPLFANLVKSIVVLSGIALFVMLLIAGFKFLFSAGDQKKLEEARGTLTNAVIGLVVIVSAYLILRIIGAFTGLINLTTFDLNIW